MAEWKIHSATRALMFVLLHCPDQLSRMAISRYLIDSSNYQVLIAETQPLVMSIALNNEIPVVLLYDPWNAPSLVDLKVLLRKRRTNIRVRILPDNMGVLHTGWRTVVNEALFPASKRKRSRRQVHPRFKWKPN